MAALLASYNANEYIEMSRHLDDALADACGGITNWLFAYQQNHEIEQLDYHLDDLQVTSVSADGTVQADVTFSSDDSVTGEIVDDHLVVGLTFREDSTFGWVLAVDFPLGVPAFC